MFIKEISTAETYDLRHRVLRPSGPLSDVQFPADRLAVHFGVFEQERLVSVVTAHPENSPLCAGEGQWRIRGMATEPGLQGNGYGSEALKALLAWGKAKCIPLFWCNAREKAIFFYESYGFEIISDLFDIPGVGPHKVMWVKL
jgi:GNAT superfamily N-acetyltransferase